MASKRGGGGGGSGGEGRGRGWAVAAAVLAVLAGWVVWRGEGGPAVPLLVMPLRAYQPGQPFSVPHDERLSSAVAIPPKVRDEDHPDPLVGIGERWPSISSEDLIFNQGAAMLHGPETVVIDTAGMDATGRGRGDLYTGSEHGLIVRIPAGSTAPEVWARVGGRPLGIDFAPGPGGDLIIADAQRGLLALNRTTKELRILAHESTDGTPFNYCDDMDIAKDGTIYFSDASVIPPVQKQDGRFDFLRSSVVDILSGHPTGRLLRYTPGSGAEVLVKGLGFANGVALSQDESFVIIAETARSRVMRYWLKGPKAGTTEPFIENLPGLPDGVSRRNDGSGHFWIALVAPRLALVDLVQPYPWIKSILLQLPESIQPRPQLIAQVIECDENGIFVQSLQGEIHGPTAVSEFDDALYLGSLHSSAIWKVSLHK